MSDLYSPYGYDLHIARTLSYLAVYGPFTDDPDASAALQERIVEWIRNNAS